MPPFRVHLKSPWGAISISGILGFLIGILSYPSWHHAIEGAQALSGIVAYPYPTPFYIYQIKAWTLLHQIPAVLLMLGATEIQLALLLSGLVGALSYMGITATAYAMTEETPFAIAIPFLVNYTGMVSYGPIYPILLMGATPSYGIFGQFWMLLALGLLCSNRHRAAGLMFGLAPAIHIGLAATLYAITIPYLCIWNRGLLRKVFGFWLAGLGLAFLSYCAHPFFMGHHNFPSPEPVSRELFAQYVRNWDSHRKPVGWDDAGLWVSFLAAFIAFACYVRHRNKLQESASRLLLCSILAGAWGFIGMIISWLPQEKIPDLLLRIMPARILNYNILLFPIIAIGSLKKRHGLIAQLISFFGLFYFLIIARFERFFTDPAVYFIGMCSLILALSGWKLKEQPRRIISEFVQNLILILLVIKLTFSAVMLRHDPWPGFQDWSNDPFFAKVKEGQGILLLAPEFNAMQLLTRRPVLIDGGALDIISYFPEIAGPIASIMTDIYGIDLFNPPSGIEHVAILPDQMSRPIWEARTAEQWSALKQEYKFTEIITSGWNLQLPLIAENENYKLHRVP